MNPRLIKLIKEIQFNSPFRRYFFPRYTYNFNAAHLCFLCQCIEDTKYIEGNIAEIGCELGCTTLFLNNYMDAQEITKTYYAMDTFEGFTAEDVEYEVANRGKATYMYTGFSVNKKKWFDAIMHQNNYTRVKSIKMDVNKYDLTTLGSLCFILLDVDLYLPIKKALPELYQILSPGGIMVVDDCDPFNILWDGSYQAYKEFIEERNYSTEIIHGKLGIVRKDA